MDCDIRNFILTRYLRETWDNNPHHMNKACGNMDMQKWHEVQEMLYKQQIKQLKYLYPKATIHVLTNDEKRLKEKDVTVHYKKDMPSCHLAKLNVYGLIDEPAMYIDNDIIIVRKWNQKELETDAPFNLYRKNSQEELQKWAKEKLPVDGNGYFNAGIIWIKKPSKSLVETLQEYHEKYFSDREKIINLGGWADSDELPVTLYVYDKKYQMKKFKTVGVGRNQIKFDEMKKFQSVHYGGLSQKMKCINEYNLIKSMKMR